MGQTEAGKKSRSSPHWFSKHALEEALSRGGCVICNALRISARRHLHSFIYEGMMSPLARQDFLDGGGFCPKHFWEAQRIEAEHWAEGFGVAILCENLLDGAREDLRRLVAGNGDGKKRVIRRSLKQNNSLNLLPGQRCITCKMLKENEEHLLGVLEELLDEDGGFRARYEQGGALCLPHLQAGLIRWPSTAARELARQTAENSINALLTELREFQRKHDYQYKNEPRGQEWSSPERAITLITGLPMDGPLPFKAEFESFPEEVRKNQA